VSHLQPIIEHQNQRILTTAQLATAYGTDEKRISENFVNNKDRYTEGKHFYSLSGEQLKAFKEGSPQIAEYLKYAPSVYLWTEKGAWLHAKSLNTDRAWEAYEKLVDDYFRVLAIVPQYHLPATFHEALRMLADEVEQNQLMLPKAVQYDTFISAKGAQSMNTVAKALGTGRTKLFSFLRTHGILMASNTPYQRYLDEGYFIVVEKTIDFGGNPQNKPQTLVTAKGVDYIGKLLAREKSLVVAGASATTPLQ